MKLTLYHRSEPLRALDLMCSVDPSNEPNRPQISSVTSNVKEPKRTKPTDAPDPSSAPACPSSRYCPEPLAPQDPQSDPSNTLSAAGEGGSTDCSNRAQEVFCKNMTDPLILILVYIFQSFNFRTSSSRSTLQPLLPLRKEQNPSRIRRTGSRFGRSLPSGLGIGLCIGNAGLERRSWAKDTRSTRARAIPLPRRRSRC